MSRKNIEALMARVHQLIEDENAVEELMASLGEIPDELLTPRNRACRQGDYTTFNRLPVSDERDAQQGPALFFAIRGGDWRIIEGCMSEDVDERFGGQRTPLMIAAQYGQMDAIEVFLNCEAQLDLVDKNGESAVHIAARAGEVGALDALLYAGANPKLVDPRGRTRSPLAISVDEGHARCVVRLLLAGMSSNDPEVDQAKLQELKETNGELWSLLTFEEGSGPIMEDHFHVTDMYGVQSPRCPFCGTWASDRLTYEEAQGASLGDNKCEHRLTGGWFMFAFHEPGPLSEDSHYEKDLFADGGRAANALRAAVRRLIRYADDEDLDRDTLIQEAYGTRPVWWNDEDGELNESMDWVAYAFDDDIASCSYLYEDIRFVSLETVHCYYAEDPEVARRGFTDTISAAATRLESWLDARITNAGQVQARTK